MSGRIITAVLVALAAAAVLAYNSPLCLSEEAQSHTQAASLRRQVRVGMPLAEAEQILSPAWHHAQCPHHPEQTFHLFLFGSRDPAKAGVVLITTKGEVDNQIVTFVGTVENYRLVMYDRCTELDLSTASRG